MQEDKTNENKAETMANQGDNSRTQDETTHNETNETTEGKADGIGGVAEVENVSSQGDTSQQLEMNAAGEIKLEMPDNSQDRVAHGAEQSITHARNKYMKLRDAELQKLDIRGGNHDMDFKVKDESGQESENTEVDGNHRQGESMEVKNEDGVRLDGADGNSSGKDVERAVVFADESGKDGNNNINQQMERVQEVEYENVEKPNETAADADKQKSDELQQSGENDSAVQQKTENWDRDKADQNSGENDSAVQQKTEMRDGDKADQNSQEAGESEVAGTRDTETDFRESRDEAEEDKESGEETDELEF